MSAIGSITKALDTALYNFGQANGIDTALENDGYEPSTNKNYLSSFVLNTGVETADLGCTDVRDLIYQIDINVKSHTGSATINALADELNKTFKAGAYFYHNGVCVCVNQFEPTRILPSNGWATLPINVTCDSYTAKI